VLGSVRISVAFEELGDILPNYRSFDVQALTGSV
jgi:hypothetical protein